MFKNNTDTLNNESEESDQNLIKIAERYDKAFNQNQSDGQYIIGSLYYNGKGVIQDYKEAMEWFLQAAKHNHSLAQYFIGFMYFNGHGVEKDIATAKTWISKSANQGIKIAIEFMKNNS